MITRKRMYMDDPVPPKMLESVLQEFLRDAERKRALRDAYENRRSILKRRRDEGLPNHLLAHGFPRYIVTMASGYLLGKPVQYQDESQREALQSLKTAYAYSDIPSVDTELAQDAGIFGKGIEILYADDHAHPRSSTLSPQQAFVVYDDSVESKPLFGVYFTENRGMDGTAHGYSVQVYTSRMVYRYSCSHLGLGDLVLAEKQPHYFGGVPMIEYWNCENESGDFEQVQGLIDAYDALQSDRVNDKEQFVDALLVITGARMEQDERGRSPGEQLRQDKLLYLPDSDASVSYLARSLQETDVEVLKDAIKKDIHKFSMVPDLTDENFSGNSSGVAMKYKLLGLEQLVRIKERWFREALRERMRRYASFLQVQGFPALDAGRVSMVFTRSLPANDLEVSQTVMNYAGLVPKELLLTQVPFIEDAEKAAALCEERKE